MPRNQQLVKSSSKKLSQLASLKWFRIHEDKINYIATFLDTTGDNKLVASKVANLINTSGISINASSPFRAHSKQKHNILYFDELDFNRYFSFSKASIPEIEPAPNSIIRRFFETTTRRSIHKKATLAYQEKPILPNNVYNYSYFVIQPSMSAPMSLSAVTPEFKMASNPQMTQPCPISLNTSFNSCQYYQLEDLFPETSLNTLTTSVEDVNICSISCLPVQNTDENTPSIVESPLLLNTSFHSEQYYCFDELFPEVLDNGNLPGLTPRNRTQPNTEEPAQNSWDKSMANIPSHMLQSFQVFKMQSENNKATVNHAHDKFQHHYKLTR